MFCDLQKSVILSSSFNQEGWSVERKSFHRGLKLCFVALWVLEQECRVRVFISCRSCAERRQERGAGGRGDLLSSCPGEACSGAVFWLRTRICINLTDSWKQVPPAANSKHLGQVVIQAFRYAYLFLIQSYLPTRALLVHGSSGKDDFIIWSHIYVYTSGRIWL